MNHYFRRYKRYIIFLFNYLFRERIRGLDFTMRDKHLLVETKGRYSGYSITPAGHLKDILSRLSISGEDSLIDIGCGKGYVLWQASKYPFQKITGIDIDSNLIWIATKNIQRLNLKNVDVICSNAADFDTYYHFNYFFFYNPFGMEVFKAVFDNLMRSLEKHPRKIVIIYYHPACASYIDQSGRFTVRHRLYDNIKNYDTLIYETCE